MTRFLGRAGLILAAVSFMVLLCEVLVRVLQPMESSPIRFLDDVPHTGVVGTPMASRIIACFHKPMLSPSATHKLRASM